MDNTKDQKMPRFKKYGIYLALLFVLITIISLVCSNDYKATLSKDLNVPANFVYNAINNLETQKDWNNMAINDTSFNLIFSGKTFGKEASCDFTSSKYGNGVIKIIEAYQNDSIFLESRTNEESVISYKYYLTTLDSTTVNLRVEGLGNVGFIKNIVSFFYKWKLKRQLDKSITKLEELMNNRYVEKIYRGYKIKQENIGPKFYIYNRAEVEFNNIDQYYTQNISALYQTAIKENVTIPGPPCGLFFNWDKTNKKTDMAAALPTLAELRFVNTGTISIPAKMALIIEFVGDRNKSKNAHNAMDDFILDHKLKNDAPVIEEYVTDPTAEPDMSKWITNILYYVSYK